MLDYFIASNLITGGISHIPNNNNNIKNDGNTLAFTYFILFMIWIGLWIWAVTRAINCSIATPDSRTMHLFFAVSSPIFYIIFSYTVSGMCPPKEPKSDLNN